MNRRSKGRECALQIMFDADFSGVESRSAIEVATRAYWQNFASEGASHAFAESLVFGVFDNLPAIDKLIKDASTRWSLERMAAVDRNILRLGTYELMQGEPVAPVVINEAVELAKKFGAEQSAAFVNGILDEIRRVLEENAH